MALDSVSLKVDGSVIKNKIDISWSDNGKGIPPEEQAKFEYAEMKKNVANSFDTRKSSILKLGHGGIKIYHNETIEYAIIDFSAKALGGANYGAGISSNNLDLLFHNLQESAKGYCTLDKNIFFDTAIVHTMDNTINIHVSENILDVLTSICYGYSLNNKDIDSTNLAKGTINLMNGSEGFVFYDKDKELLEQSTDFRKHIPREQLSNNIIRVEHRIKTKAKLDYHFTKEFAPLLHGEKFKNMPFTYVAENPKSARLLRNKFSEIKIIQDDKKLEELDLFDIRYMIDRIVHENKMDLVKMYGYPEIFKELGSNYNTLKTALKKKHDIKNNKKGSWSKEFREYKKAISDFNKEQMNKKSKNDLVKIGNEFKDVVLKEIDLMAVS